MSTETLTRTVTADTVREPEIEPEVISFLKASLPGLDS